MSNPIFSSGEYQQQFLHLQNLPPNCELGLALVRQLKLSIMYMWFCI